MPFLRHVIGFLVWLLDIANRFENLPNGSLRVKQFQMDWTRLDAGNSPKTRRKIYARDKQGVPEAYYLHHTAAGYEGQNVAWDSACVDLGSRGSSRRLRWLTVESTTSVRRADRPDRVLSPLKKANRDAVGACVTWQAGDLTRHQWKVAVEVFCRPMIRAWSWESVTVRRSTGYKCNGHGPAILLNASRICLSTATSPSKRGRESKFPSTIPERMVHAAQ